MRKIIFISIVLVSVQSTFAQEEDNLLSYDSIVEELSSPQTISTLETGSPFSNLLLHSGVGFAMSMNSILLNGKQSDRGFLQGVEVNLGIDLFSRNWVAEGSYRNLGRGDVDSELKTDQISLNEFDLKLVHLSPVGRLLNIKLGGGMSARYLTHTNLITGSETVYTTPAWLLFLGLNTKISNTFTFGGEVAYRSSMIDETIDKSALGASIRVDAHF